MLRDQLLARGVDASAIELIPDEPEAVSVSLNMAQEGDLVVLFADDVSRSWNQVIHYEGENASSETSADSISAQSFVEEDPDAFSMEPGARLVTDERGVRIAREEEESD
jgi:cyanophycin synthetase